jgi:hypothetical protein
MERRTAREEKAQKGDSETRSSEASMHENELQASPSAGLKPSLPQRKHIPLKLRDEVLTRLRLRPSSPVRTRRSVWIKTPVSA